MNAYEAKLAAKRDRLLARAERLRLQSQGTYEQAKQMAAVIPFGQPILVGHHSEARDRRYRAKINAAYDRAIAQHKEAAEVAARAAAVGTGGISSDDPDAVKKLRDKLLTLEKDQEQMTAVNKAWRKAGKPKPDDDAGWMKVADLTGRSINDFIQLRRDFARFPWQGQPFAPFSLSNNSAEIRRCKARIQELEKKASLAEEAAEIERVTVGGVRVVENRADNRMQLFFPGKPAADVIKSLKSRGFRWAPSVMAWQAHLSHRSKWAAECVIRDIGDSFAA